MLRQGYEAPGLEDRNETVPLYNDSVVSEQRFTQDGGNALGAELGGTSPTLPQVLGPAIEHNVEDQVGAARSQEAL